MSRASQSLHKNAQNDKRSQLEINGLGHVSRELSDSDLAEISNRGYEIINTLGGDGETSESHGKTRIACQTTYESGNVERPSVLKIPKRNVDQNSVRSKLNRAKGNKDFEEARAIENLVHPNIVTIFDSFQLEDGRTANAEESLEGQDLENLVSMAGSLDSGRVDSIFGKALSGVNHAHSKGILHRDLKPSNIMVGPDYEAKVVDWQNAKKKENIDFDINPTWGGAKYTSPDLLNSLVEGRASRSDERSDLYSLGGVLYFMLTGEDPTNYKLVEDSSGTKIDTDEDSVGVRLKQGKEEVESISLKQHRKNVRKAARKIPWKYRRFVRSLLDPEKEYTTSQAMEDFNKIKNSWKTNLLEKTLRYAKIAGITSLATVGVGFGAYAGIMAESNSTVKEKTTFSEMLRNQTKIEKFSQGRYESAAAYEHYPSKKSPLEKDLSEIKERIKEIDENNTKWLSDNSNDFYRSNGIDPKLAKSYLRSIMSVPELKEKQYEGRVSPYLVPDEFVEVTREGTTPPIDRDHIETVSALRHVQNCYDVGDSLPRVYADAICDSEEIERAKYKALIHDIGRDHSFDISNSVPMGELMSDENINPINYFSRKERSENGNSYETIPGYRGYLDPLKRKIIDRALMIYAISDDDGNINWENYSKRPINGLEER